MARLIRWQTTVADGSGNVLQGASVQINVSGGGAASLFTAADGLTPKTNPLTSDANGFVFAYLAAGVYDIIATKGALNVTHTAVELAGTDADQQAYSNTTSGMTAVDSQSAIDEVEARVEVLEGAGHISDAPSDGNQYARKDGGWTVVEASGGSSWTLTEATTGTLSAFDMWDGDASGGAITRNAPLTLSAGDELYIANSNGSADATNTITLGRNGHTINGLAEDLVISTAYGWVRLKYNGTTLKVVGAG